MLASEESAAPSQIPVEHESPCHLGELTCSAEKWDIFLNEWAKFATVSDLDDEQMAPQCRGCLTDRLKDAVTDVRGDVSKLEVEDLLDKVRSIAVNPPIGALRAIAHAAKQADGESFTYFAARVAELVSVCEYTSPCPHAPTPSEGEVPVLNCGLNSCVGNNY